MGFAIRSSLTFAALVAGLTVLPAATRANVEGQRTPHKGARIRPLALATALAIGATLPSTGHSQPGAAAAPHAPPRAGEVQVCGSELRLALPDGGSPHGGQLRLPWHAEVTMRYGDSRQTQGIQSETVPLGHYEGNVATLPLASFARFVKNARERGLPITVRVSAHLPKVLRGHLPFGGISREFVLAAGAGSDPSCNEPAKHLVQRRLAAEALRQPHYLLPDEVVVSDDAAAPPVTPGSWNPEWSLPLQLQPGDAIHLRTRGGSRQELNPAVTASMEAVTGGPWIATPNDREWDRYLRLTLPITSSPHTPREHAEPCSFVVPVTRSTPPSEADQTKARSRRHDRRTEEQPTALQLGLQALIGDDGQPLIQPMPNGKGHMVLPGYCEEDGG
jgi:hypothetical protein